VTTTAAEAIETLVARVRTEMRGGDQDARAALAGVLEHLDVASGHPAWADGRDVIGEAYERLVPTATRRPLGQFCTPLWAGRPMADWLMAGAPDVLLDAGCGSGSLLIAADSARGAQPTRLVGVDRDPLALTMAATTRDLRGMRDLTLQRRDFLLDDLDVRPSAIICNPPYTRHQDLPSETKAQVHDGLIDRLGLRLSRLASLHVLFLVRAVEIAAEDARIAFLTPAQWLDTNYAQAVKKWILERAHVEALVTFPVEDRVFNHAVTTAGVTLIRMGAAPPGHHTRIVRLGTTKQPETELRKALVEGGRSVTLQSNGRWSRTRTPRTSGGVALSEVADVHRGIATGHNAFFVLSEQRRRELELEQAHFLPCIASPRHFSGTILRAEDFDDMDDTVPRWLLALDRVPNSAAMIRYLRGGREHLDVRGRTLVQQRMKAGRRWFQVERSIDAPILFRYLNASPARFVRNAAGAAPLNNWLVVQPHDGIDVDRLFGALSKAGEHTSLREDSRHYGKGLWKLEPRELREIVLPVEAGDLVIPSR